MTQALLLIDIQNDYFPGGAMELSGSVEAGTQAGKLLRHFREKSLPVIHVQHIANRPGATFFLPGTVGMEFHSSVAPLPGEPIIQKHYPSGFRDTALLDHLRSLGISKLVIAGMMTHMCVDTTTRAAADLGFQCQLAQDACATKALSFAGEVVPAPQVQVAYLAALNGTFADVLPAETIIASHS